MFAREWDFKQRPTSKDDSEVTLTNIQILKGGRTSTVFTVCFYVGWGWGGLLCLGKKMLITGVI